ncbi:glycosyltransferase [Rhodobacteraceae bacterium RKSG542]|uniref:glycosyltransferase family 4 protein n=1 Tax=Pseudovibrio flavus TaxID=2529854 RepID=UPI0012BD5834|nr:glycosyltransferase family 4 protein [Pseudovibrio flavus]MTI16146.1 glycosyltransferase [Pseudovibrio flavus]
MTISVNFVATKKMNSKIFTDIFRRFINRDDLHTVVSERPLEGFDIYHYHRPQMEKGELMPGAVVTVHHDVINDFDPFVDFEKFRPHYENAGHIICLNSNQAEYLASQGITQTTIIPHGYEDRLFRRRPLRRFSADYKIKIGFISKRYGRRVKGEVLLYEMLEGLSPERVEFVLVGEGRSQDAAYIREMGFECECFEFLPYRLFPKVYEEIDFLLVLSNAEGGPANIAEAVASGTPVLSRPVGIALDAVSDGVNGLYLSGEASENAEVIRRLADNEQGLFDTLMVGAHKQETAITWSQVIDRHIEVYEKVLAKPKSSAVKFEGVVPTL